MKTPEDEAFEDIERRQGGFKAKQGMAMHKTQDQNICRHYKQWQHCHICDLESQVAELEGIKAALAQSAQRPWVGLTDEETSGFTQHEMTVVNYVSKVLQEKNA
jgi:hypothetical protein